MRHVAVFFLFCLLLIIPSLGQVTGLEINGDNVLYDKDDQFYRASGSVEVTYQNVLLRGNLVEYDVARERLKAEKGFVLDYEGITIEGETLTYSVTAESGQATKIDFVYQGIELGGDELIFSRDDFHLRQAHFTTCDLAEPHYHVSAADIYLYPRYGWLVAYWGFFWLGNVPVVPMPTYIYDMLADESGQSNIPPFPEISSNNDDGWYINEHLAWHLRRELSGTYTLSLYEKKGPGGGAEANYVLDDNNRGNVRLYGNVVDGLWGGVTHHYYFGDKAQLTETPVNKFLALPKTRQYEVIANATHRERINYQRISYYPQLTFKSKSGEIGRPEARYDLMVAAASVAEENNINLLEGNGNLKLYWDFPEIMIGDLTPNLGTEQNYYSNGTNWVKNFAGLDLKKKFSSNLTAGLGYLHFFSIDGTSPFLFELYKWRPADVLKGNLFFVLGETGVGLDAAYYLDNWAPEDIDYSLFFRLHCYNLIVKYRSLRGEFNLGFSLAGGE